MELSIITAVHPDRAHFIDEAAASIEAMRKALSIQWVLCWDGEPTAPVKTADVQIVGRPGSGISITRNLALSELECRSVSVLDADDLLVPDGAVAAVESLAADSTPGWIGCSRTFVDGTPTRHTFHQDTTFAAGELAESWTAPFVFHPNSVVLRTDLLRLLGGWPAIPSNEDLAMVLLASEVKPGRSLAQVLTRYRVWDQQEVNRSDYVDTKQQSFRFIVSHLNQVRRGYGRPAITGPVNVGGAFGRMEVQQP